MSQRTYSNPVHNNDLVIVGDANVQGDMKAQRDIVIVMQNSLETNQLVELVLKMADLKIQDQILPQLAEAASNTMKASFMAFQYINIEQLGLDPGVRLELADVSQKSEAINLNIKRFISEGAQVQMAVHNIEDLSGLVGDLNAIVASLDRLNEESAKTSGVVEKAVKAFHDKQMQRFGDRASSFSNTRGSTRLLTEDDTEAWAQLRSSLVMFGMPEKSIERNRHKIILTLSKFEDASESHSMISVSAPSQASNSKRLRMSLDLRRFAGTLRGKVQQLSPIDHLTMACATGNFDQLEQALRDGANVNHRGQTGNTPLISAIINGDRDNVKYLLHRNADPNLADQPNSLALKRTPVIVATESSAYEILELLLESGADANGASPDFQGAALDLAVGKWDLECARLLLEGGADPTINLHEVSLLDRAVSHNKYELVRLLLKHGASLSEPRPTPVPVGPSSPGTLEMAFQKRSLESLKVILAHLGGSAKANIDHYRLLFKAAERGWANMVQVLLDFGADPQLTAQTVFSGSKVIPETRILCNAMHVALLHGYLKMAQQLVGIIGNDMTIDLYHGLQHNEMRRSTLVHIFLRTGSPNMINAILRLGGDLNVRDGFGRTSLHQMPNLPIEHLIVAIKHFSEDLVNAQDYQGRAALHVAVLAGSHKAIAILLANGARLELGDSRGIRPLHLAVMSFRRFEYCYATMNILLSRRADANATTNDGDTALHHLARKHVHPAEALRMMIMLVQEGEANLDATDAQGCTARSRLRDVLQTWVLEGVDANYPQTLDDVDLSLDFDQPSGKYHNMQLARRWLFPENDAP